MSEPTPRETPLPQLDAIYELESWVRCPACRQDIQSVGVVRMLRTKVNFISSLPRRGHLAVCPQCRTVLPVELGGLLTT